jgi:dTDP-glucose pyrophosphorylase
MSGPLQIVVPMAGRGSRFTDAGYEQPKPLIDVLGKPMIQRVVENLTPIREHRFVFIGQREHLERYRVGQLLTTIAPTATVVALDAVTEGAACTVLTARDHLEGELPLMIANCDQWLDTDIDAYLMAADSPDTDGLIMTMPADHPKWSYVGLDDQGLVSIVVEKQVISPHATVGVYNFARAAAFTSGADRMISADKRVNGEFYVAPVYNELIGDGALIRVHDVGPAMWGLGTPDDLDVFRASGPLA